MALVVLVCLGVAGYCFYHGYFSVGAVCIGGISHRVGWLCLAFVTGALLWEGHWLVAILPPLLIGWNVFGPRLLFSKERLRGHEEMVREETARAKAEWDQN